MRHAWGPARHWVQVRENGRFWVETDADDRQALWRLKGRVVPSGDGSRIEARVTISSLLWWAALMPPTAYGAAELLAIISIGEPLLACLALGSWGIVLAAGYYYLKPNADAAAARYAAFLESELRPDSRI